MLRGIIVTVFIETNLNDLMEKSPMLLVLFLEMPGGNSWQRSQNNSRKNEVQGILSPEISDLDITRVCFLEV